MATMYDFLGFCAHFGAPASVHEIENTLYRYDWDAQLTSSNWDEILYTYDAYVQQCNAWLIEDMQMEFGQITEEDRELIYHEDARIRARTLSFWQEDFAYLLQRFQLQVISGSECAFNLLFPGDWMYIVKITYQNNYTGEIPSPVFVEPDSPRTFGSSVTEELLPTLASTPENTFNCWMVFLTPVVEGQVLTSDATFNASFYTNYLLTYYSDHGTLPASKYCRADAYGDYSLTQEDLPVLSEEGWAFLEWQDAQGNSLEAGQSINSSLNLYAVWEQEQSTSLFFNHSAVWAPKYNTLQATLVRYLGIQVFPGTGPHPILTNSYFDLTLTSVLTIKIYITQTTDEGVEFDWGDGSDPERLTGLTGTLEHVYASAGNYRLLATADSGVTWTPGDGSYSMFGTASSKGITTPYVIAVGLDSSVSGLPISAFEGCNALESIELPQISSIGNYAFYGCTALSDITIPASVSSIGTYAFYNCAGLTVLSLPNLTTLGDYAFQNCTALSSVYFGIHFSSLGNSAFNGCSNLADISVAPDNEFFLSVDGILYSRDQTVLWLVPANKNLSQFSVPAGVTTIKQYALDHQAYIQQLTVPSSVTTIETRAFQYMAALQTLIMHASIDTIPSYMCYYCTALWLVTIPNVTTISTYAFYHCDSLQTFTIPSSVTTIGTYCFAYTGLLGTVEIPSTVSSLGGSAFRYCTSITHVILAAVSMATYCFAGCTALQQVWIRRSTTTITAGSYSASPWNGDTQLTQIYAEASSKPSGWGTYWNYKAQNTTVPVTWNQTTRPW